MNHLGKENSFSFQRTIHALNEGLKLIIRGGYKMNKLGDYLKKRKMLILCEFLVFYWVLYT